VRTLIATVITTEVKNLTDYENSLKELSKDKSVVIMKADKGNRTVLLRKLIT